MSVNGESVADALGRIETLAAAMGVSRIALIHLAGGPIAAGRIAGAFAAGVVTITEARDMLAEARVIQRSAPNNQERL